MTVLLATDLDTFADERGRVLAGREADLLGSAKAALRHFPDDGWYSALLDRATRLVRKQYHEDTGRWTSARLRTAVSAYRKQAEDMLKKTAEEENHSAQAQRIATSLATAAVNTAIEVAGLDTENLIEKVWVSREDERVRPTHAAAHGQRQKMGEMFTVGGVEMRRPGDLRAPIEEWINCRCVLAVVAEGEKIAASLVAATEGTTMADDDQIDEEFPPLPENERLEAVDEAVPFWGVLAPEDEWSGDGRRFKQGALRARPLPLPLAYQKVNQPGHDASFRVANIERTWRRSDGMVYGSGHFLTVIPEVDEVVGIMAESGGRMGVSIDADDGAMEMILRDGRTLEEALDAMEEGDEGIDMDDVLTEFTTARVCGATLCNIPAFHQAFIALGDTPEEFADGDDLAIESRDEAEAAAAAAAPFREVDTEERKKSADKGHALPDGSFPIETVEDLKNAIQAIGRAKDPAKAKAHIKKRARALGHEELIPDDWSIDTPITAAGPVKTEDGPGWLTHPVDTDRLRDYWVHGRGAAKINWGVPGDFNRCRANLAKYVKPQYLNGYCANRHYDALGFWPGRPVAGDTVAMSAQEYGALVASGEMAPAINLVEDTPAGLYPPAEWFEDPHLVTPSAISITKEGRVFGYLATWGTCHIGFKDVCVTPPQSPSNYAYFKTGVALTAEGDEVPVGTLTMDTGHAGIRASAKTAMAHYDNTGTVSALVNVGEDDIGIWVAGAIAPGVDPAKVVVMRAGALSGDWREIGGALELVAGLVVNVPGFPIPRTALAASGGHQKALVAAGMVVLTAAGEPATHLTVEEIVEKTLNAAAERAAAKKRMEELAASAAREQRDAMAAVAARMKEST